MTDARTGMADQIQTLTQLTAICSQRYYSKWHYSGMCGCKTCWCAAGGVCLSVCTCLQVLMSELGAAGLNIEWIHRPNGNSGSWLRQMVFEAWCLNWERERAKYGHTLCNDIMLDKCHISAFVACKNILKHTWNRQLIQRRGKKKQILGIFENGMYKTCAFTDLNLQTSNRTIR